MPLSDGEIRRLTLIKYLYQQGAQQAEEAEPLASFAILFFHDAVEWFLDLVCDHYGVDPPYPFMEYWERIRQATEGEIELGHKQPMKRLNRARRQLKHHGTFIASSSVEDLRAATEAFLTEEIRALFGASFDRLSLVELVPSEAVRERLGEAQSLYKDEQYKEALGEVAVAFEQARQELGANPLTGIDRTRPSGSELYDIGRLRGFQAFYRGLYGEIEAIEEVLRLLILDVDLPRYFRFRALTPQVNQTQDGTYHKTWYGPAARNVESEEVVFCFEFVVDTALRISASLEIS